MKFKSELKRWDIVGSMGRARFIIHQDGWTVFTSRGQKTSYLKNSNAKGGKNGTVHIIKDNHY